MSENPKYMTTAEIAVYLRTSIDAVNARVRRGQIPKTAIVRPTGPRGPRLYVVSEVDKAIRRNRTDGAA